MPSEMSGAAWVGGVCSRGNQQALDLDFCSVLLLHVSVLHADVCLKGSQQAERFEFSCFNTVRSILSMGGSAQESL